ncbi:hypothetical protein [Kribbella sp. ALI-6-A]|uniref:hypothetical protein n=1 Tax=Kribbella sp. ALI-6-A TaxID=1933817 RepID=UPI00192D05B6|nr:hypothetical protein [Kribbella sp. ALI-6-A]
MTPTTTAGHADAEGQCLRGADGSEQAHHDGVEEHADQPIPSGEHGLQQHAEDRRGTGHGQVPVAPHHDRRLVEHDVAEQASSE